MTGLDTRRVGLLATLVAIVGATAVLWIFDPAKSSVFPPCPLLALTGWYCPGCGSLRSFHQLLQGNLRNAMAMNPLAVQTLPFLVYGAVSHTNWVMRGRYLPRIFLPANSIRALCVVVVIFGVVRNLGEYPFWLLAPGAMLGLQ